MWQLLKKIGEMQVVGSSMRTTPSTPHIEERVEAKE
jgi:hypothetical protein